MIDTTRKLEWSVRALAQPARVQMTLYPAFVCHADELALEFEEAMRLVEMGLFTAPQVEAIEQLDSQLAAMSGPEHEDLWTDEALESFQEWDRVRDHARNALEAMGWDSSPPPNDRGGIYVASDA